MTVLSLSFDSLQEGDRTPYNVAIHEFMVDYNNRDDARVRPKPQHKDAWQSPEALMQFAIDVFGRHKPELMDHNPHVNFRPAVFNEPIPASIQTNYTDLDGNAPSVFSTSEASSELVPYDNDQRAQLLATVHRRSSAGSGKGGGGKPSYSQLGYHGTAAGGGNPSTRLVVDVKQLPTVLRPNALMTSANKCFLKYYKLGKSSAASSRSNEVNNLR